MSGSLTTNETPVDPLEMFRNNIQERIANDFSKLMPDDVVKKLIEDSITRMLYKQEQKHGTPNSGYQRETQPYIQNAVDKFAAEKVRMMVHEALEAEKENITKLIVDTIKEKTPQMVGTMLYSLLTGSTQQFTMTILSELRVMMQNRSF